MNLLMDWSDHCYRTDVDFDSLNVILITMCTPVLRYLKTIRFNPLIKNLIMASAFKISNFLSPFFFGGGGGGNVMLTNQEIIL